MSLMDWKKYWKILFGKLKVKDNTIYIYIYIYIYICRRRWWDNIKMNITLSRILYTRFIRLGIVVTE
jgi:hypothetical protein